MLRMSTSINSRASIGRLSIQMLMSHRLERFVTLTSRSSIVSFIRGEKCDKTDCFTVYRLATYTKYEHRNDGRETSRPFGCASPI
eukprot:scaffold47193_cov58-Attheya_sp.AAC.1